MRKFGNVTRRKKYGQAFTLIETVVSVTLLIIAVVGPMTLAGRSIRVAREARQELTATYLAQEGIEMIRSVRDNNSGDDNSPERSDWLKLNGSNTIHSLCSTSCVFDISEKGTGGEVWKKNKIICTTANTDRLKVYYDPNTGLYRQDCNALSGYIDSGFTRSITLTTISARQEHITVTVTYKTAGGTTRTIISEDDIYNWFPEL